MPADRVLIFANPIAGRGRGKRLAAALVGRLGRDGLQVRLLTDRPDSADVGGDLVDGRTLAAVAVGGDGTLRAVAARLLDAVNPPPLLAVPLGTANLMGQHLGLARPGGWSAVLGSLGLPDPLALAGTFADKLPAKYKLPPSVGDWLGERWGGSLAHFADTVLEAIRAGRTRAIDVGTANGSIFLLMAGVGLDAHVVAALDAARLGPIGKLSYLRPAADALRGYHYPALTVEAEGRRVFGPAPALAFVANVPEYGTGFPLLPGARSDDGLLDLCVLPCRSPADVLEIALHAAAGEHLGREGVVTAVGRSFAIHAESETFVQVDGDPAGRTPLDVQLLDRRLELIVPKSPV